MKSLFPLLLLFALMPPLHAADQIEFATKFVEIPADAKLPDNLDALIKLEGADLLSAPRVTSKPDQKVQVEITHEVAPPAGGFITPGDKPMDGVTLVGMAHFQGDKIAYRAHLTMSRAVGDAPKDMQVETDSHDLYVTGTAEDGETVWLRFASPQDDKRLLVLLTLTRHKV